MNKDRLKIKKENEIKKTNGESISKYKIFKEIPANILSKISQPVFICEHTPIMSITNKKNFNIVNSEQFKISDITDEFIEAKRTFENLTTNKLEVKIINIPIENFQKWFHVSYAITAHKSQGCTIHVPYTIHQWEYMSNKCKYVSLSRSAKWEYCNLV